MPIFDDKRKERLNEAFNETLNETLKQEAIENLRLKRGEMNTSPETIAQPKAQPEEMPEVFYGGRTEPPSRTEGTFTNLIRKDIFGQPWRDQPTTPYELSRMNLKQKAEAGHLPSMYEYYYSPPSGFGEAFKKKDTEMRKSFMNMLIAEASQRSGLKQAKIGAEGAERGAAIAGLGDIEQERMRGETELEKERMKPFETKAPQIKSMSIGKGMLQDMIFNPNTGQYDIPFGKPHREFSPSQSQRERYQVKVDEQGKLWRLDVDTNKLIPIEAPEGTKFTKPEKEKDWIEQQLENTAKQGGYKWENGKLVPY